MNVDVAATFCVRRKCTLARDNRLNQRGLGNARQSKQTAAAMLCAAVREVVCTDPKLVERSFLVSFRKPLRSLQREKSLCRSSRLVPAAVVVAAAAAAI